MDTAFVGVSLLAIASGQTMINRQVDRIASKLTPTVPACGIRGSTTKTANFYNLKCPTMPFNSVPRDANSVLDAALPRMANAD